MSAEAYHHHDVHRLVDQLGDDQADEVRAYMLRLVTARAPHEDGEPTRRRFSFVGTLEAEPDLAERSEDILREITRRNAG